MQTALSRKLIHACAALAIAATASSALAAGGDTYIITDGKGATQVVTTTGPMSTTVAPSDNPSNSATGTISTWTDKAGHQHNVFHGTLNGEADPKPGKDGWGIVFKVPPGDFPAADFAAMVAKFNIGGNMVSETLTTCDGPGVEQKFMDAIASADALITKVNASSLTADQKTELLNALNDLKMQFTELKAIAHDIGNVTNPSIDQLGQLVEKFKNFKKKHKKAQKALKALLEKLVKTGLLAQD